MEKVKKHIIHGFKCIHDGHIFKCENNKTGEISKYIKNLGYNDDYKNHIESCDINVNVLCCPYCNYTTKDTYNKSGTLTVHIKKEHNKTPIELLSEFPEYEQEFSKQKNIHNKELLAEDVGVECKICGKKFKRLSRTHLSLHGLTPSEYENKYGKNSTLSTYTRIKQSNSSFSSQIDRIYNRIYEAECTPMFELSDYHGVVDMKYKFKCNLCGCEFIDTLDNGNVPKCPKCKKYNRNFR